MDPVVRGRRILNATLPMPYRRFLTLCRITGLIHEVKDVTADSLLGGDITRIDVSLHHGCNNKGIL